MTLKSIAGSLCAAALLIAAGIALYRVEFPSVDQEKFRPLYRSGKAIEGALAASVTLPSYRDLVGTLGTEVSAAKDLQMNSKEREMVDTYVRAFDGFRDAAMLWQSSLFSFDTSTSPATTEVQDIILKYPISGTGSGASFQFVPKSAVQTIWSGAEARLQDAENLYVGR